MWIKALVKCFQPAKHKVSLTSRAYDISHQIDKARRLSIQRKI